MKAKHCSKDSRIVSHVERLIKLGWTLQPGNPHHKIVSPCGCFVHAIPGSPSDHRSALNWISQLRHRARAFGYSI